MIYSKANPGFNNSANMKVVFWESNVLVIPWQGLNISHISNQDDKPKANSKSRVGQQTSTRQKTTLYEINSVYFSSKYYHLHPTHAREG